MRKLIMWNLVSLDGYFEGAKSWDLGWHESVLGDELERLSIDQLKSADMLLFGRVTYEGMAGYWPSAKGEVADRMNNIRKVVFSRTLEKASWNNTKLVKGNAAEEVAKLKEQKRQRSVHLRKREPFLDPDAPSSDRGVPSLHRSDRPGRWDPSVQGEYRNDEAEID